MSKSNSFVLKAFTVIGLIIVGLQFSGSFSGTPKHLGGKRRKPKYLKNK